MGEVEDTQASEPSRKSFGWSFWLFVVVLIAILAGFTQPMVVRSKMKPYQTEATSNLYQIGIVLREFNETYGSFPSESTVALVNETNPKHGLNLSGKSSNALFRQLFAAELTDSEVMFYAKVKATRKPDGDISPGQALKKGEVAFGYIAGLSYAGNPARPVAFCPIIPGTDRFDPKPFKGKAVVLRMDNSVTSVNIDKHGHVLLGGFNILSAENPIWGEEDIIDIRYPDL